MQFGLFGAATAQRGGPDVDSAAGFTLHAPDAESWPG
jgi:hypothetical protein